MWLKYKEKSNVMLKRCSYYSIKNIFTVQISFVSLWGSLAPLQHKQHLFCISLPEAYSEVSQEEAAYCKLQK